MSDMSFGQKFAAVQTYSRECVDDCGMGFLLKWARQEFESVALRHPEVIVVFDHTIRQRTDHDFIGDQTLVLIEAYVLRSQLAIEEKK